EAVIGIIYLAGVLLTWRRARGFIAAEKAEKSAAFAYLIGDSFAKLGLGMIADGTPVFGLTGWAGTFAALDAAAAAGRPTVRSLSPRQALRD
ncbi:hypothetical protein FK521_27765, partial [Klebsiella pneumoniae]|nr:hypothetical protein [Klebsiella pneumoniae]